MIRRQKVHALVLDRIKVGEADRRVTLFTRRQGVLNILAKGVRKIPSRRGGHLEPCTAVMALVAASSANHYLAAVETTNYYPALHRDPQAAATAHRLGKLIVQLVSTSEANFRLYDALEQSWQILPTLPSVKREVLEVAMTLYVLKAAGLAPNLAACHVCGTRLPTEAVILDGVAGSWHCLLCHPGFSGTHVSLPPLLLRVLRFVSARPQQALQLNLDGEASRQLKAAMAEYVRQIQ